MAVARATPAGARLGHPSGTAGEAPDNVPDKFENIQAAARVQRQGRECASLGESGASLLSEPIEDRDLKFLRQLDELKPTLSYEGWQKDLETAESLFVSQPNAALSRLDEMRREQLLYDYKSGRAPPPPPPPPGALPPQPADISNLEAELRRVYRRGLARKDYSITRAKLRELIKTTAETAPVMALQDPEEMALRLELVQIQDEEINQDEDEDGPQATDSTRSAAMPAASLGSTKYDGYELSYTDAGTLQIYIPAKGAGVWDKAAATTVTVASMFTTRKLVRAVPLAAAAAAGTAAAPALVVLLLFDLFSIGGAGYVCKETIIEPATDTTITIGRYEWTVVRRTVAGVVTFDKQGATEGLIQDYWALVKLAESDEELSDTEKGVRFKKELKLLKEGEGLFCVLKQIARDPNEELVWKVLSHVRRLDD